MKTADLTLLTFRRYVAEFMCYDKLLDGTTTPSPSNFTLNVQAWRNATASVADMLAPAVPYAFSSVYLQRVPDLRYLARRIILRIERNRYKEYLRNRKDRIIEPEGGITIG